VKDALLAQALGSVPKIRLSSEMAPAPISYTVEDFDVNGGYTLNRSDLAEGKVLYEPPLPVFKSAEERPGELAK
jgi:hypothetical protein